ncbi:hypothetical protein THAOC_31890, partial [Thalassiosira oceanica]
MATEVRKRRAVALHVIYPARAGGLGKQKPVARGVEDAFPIRERAVWQLNSGGLVRVRGASSLHTGNSGSHPKMKELDDANASLKAAHDERERDYEEEIGKLDNAERDLLDRISKLNGLKDETAK